MTSTTNATTWDERLLLLLQQQHSLLQRLAELAQKQGSLIADGRTDALLRLLGERQQIIDRFLAMQNELGDLSENLQQRLEDVASDRRQVIESLIQQIGEMLDTVMKHDETDRHALEVARNETRDELAAAGTAGRARQAYLNAVGNQAKFADRQG